MSRPGPKYRQASFRGVPFHVDTSDLEFGQRIAKHEFPGKKLPYGEPLGRKGRTFQLEAFIIGDDYWTSRDALIAACEAEGPGELIHPYYGRQIVCCEPSRVREDKSANGMAVFTLNFFEAGEASNPAETPDAVSGLLSAVSAALDAVNGDFEKSFHVDRRPSFVVNDAVSMLSDATDLTEKATKGFRSRAQGIADFSYKIRNFKAGLSDLVKTPGKLSQQLSDSVALLSGLLPGGDRKELASAYQFILTYGSDLPAVPLTTSTRMQQATNQKAILDHVKRTATVLAVSEAGQADYDSLEQATQMRDSLLKEIDAQMETASDEVFSAFQALRAKFVSTVPPVDEDLPHLVSYSPPGTLPSLVVVYGLYEDLELESRTLLRNKIRNPAFIRGGQEIKVLRKVSGS